MANSTQLRSDARDNRDRIVAAARSSFAEAGLDVGMREVARRAGVGPATLYRRFPTRQDLVEAAFAVELATCRSIVVDGCANADPRRGFDDVVRRLLALNTQNRGFVDAFVTSGSGPGTIARHRREMLRMLADLVRRTQQAGGLRPDVTVRDIVLVLDAGRSLSGGPRARTSVARFADLILDGLR